LTKNPYEKGLKIRKVRVRKREKYQKMIKKDKNKLIA